MARIKKTKFPILRSAFEYMAIEDLNDRALAIYQNQLRGRCSESRAAIRSVEGVGVIGVIVQSQIEAEEAK